MRCAYQSNPVHTFVIQNDIPLADKNWFRTGGVARFFTIPQTVQQFSDVILHAHNLKLPIFLLGAGANVLISDDGFDGLIIHPQLKAIEHRILSDTHAEVIAGAGVLLHDLIVYCLEHQLLGLEEFSGIPGTVGGAVYINLHYFSFFIADFLVCAQIIDSKTGSIETVDADWFQFGYNQSCLHDGAHYVASATFRLRRASETDVVYACGRRDEMIRQRTQRYPSSHTCGSFFRNFHDHEVTIEDRSKKMVYIAYYLDKIGVKGQLRVGGAQVSYQHANMIVNVDNATSSDIIAVARRMQELVYEQFGIVPQPECRLVGFKENPLLDER